MINLWVVAMVAGVVALLPATTAHAAEAEYSYVSAAGEDMGTQKCTKVISGGNAETTWSEGWYAINTAFYVYEPIHVRGTVNLILCDKYTFIAEKGIVLEPGRGTFVCTICFCLCDRASARMPPRPTATPIPPTQLWLRSRVERRTSEL